MKRYIYLFTLFFIYFILQYNLLFAGENGTGPVLQNLPNIAEW